MPRRESSAAHIWQSGRAACLDVLETYVLGAPGDWRMLATTANGQPAAAVYRRGPDATLRADGVVVLAATATGVSRVTKFGDPALVAALGHPDVLPD